MGYLSYDAVRLFERVPDRHAPDGLPLASFSFYRSLVAFDHARQRIVLVADAEPGSRTAFERAQDVLDGFEADLRDPRPTPGPAPPSVSSDDGGDFFPDAAGFRQSVRQAQDYIAAGDIFQVVLSRRRRVECPCDPFTVYRALRMVTRRPHVLPEGRRAGGGGGVAGDAGAGGGTARRRGHRRHAPAGATAADDEGCRRSCSRTRRSGPST